MSIEKDFKLEECDEEDVADVIGKLCKSFGLDLPGGAFATVNTFGQLTDEFHSFLYSKNSDDCTTQQAFYRIREAATLAGLTTRDAILPGTPLNKIFPIKTRREDSRNFKKQLGVRFDLLTYPRWIFSLTLILFIGSVIMLFIQWRIALAGFALFLLIDLIAKKTARQLAFETAGDLADYLFRERYSSIRGKKGTVNKKEITRIIKGTFSEELFIPEENLTREAKFIWALKTPAENI